MKSGTIVIQEMIRGCMNVAATLSAVEGNAPAAGSVADVEWHGADDALASEAENAFSIASLLHYAAGDCLEGLCRLIDEPVPQFSLLVSARAAIEHSVRGWWLLDPRLSAVERAGRGLTERLASAHASVIIGAATRKSRSPEEADLADKATELGFFVPEQPLRFRLTLDGIDRPGVTDLSDAMFGDLGRDAHRFLSAAAHGTAYALVAANEPNLNSPPTGWFKRAHKDFPWIGIGICLATISYLRAFERMVHLVGWSTTEMQSWRQRVWAHLMLLLPDSTLRAPQLPGWEFHR